MNSNIFKLQGAHEMILEMVGHRDPNLVPVAAFYGAPDLKVNFCGKLAGDANTQVRAGGLKAETGVQRIMTGQQLVTD